MKTEIERRKRANERMSERMCESGALERGARGEIRESRLHGWVWRRWRILVVRRTQGRQPNDRVEGRGKEDNVIVFIVWFRLAFLSCWRDLDFWCRDSVF